MKYNYNFCSKKKGKMVLKKEIIFKVNFLPEAVEIEQPEKLVEKMEANFTCSSKPSNPGVEIVWRYNNLIMEAGGSLTEPEATYGGFTTSSFLLMTLNDEHIDGKIKCEARYHNVNFELNIKTFSSIICKRYNLTDKSVFDSIDLDVKYSPKFTSIPGPTTAEEGETVTLTVKAKANPNIIDYAWRRDNGLIVPGPGGTSHSRWSYDKVISFHQTTFLMIHT